jgi:poly(3-hydroxybutyrate) depolymerase
MVAMVFPNRMTHLKRTISAFVFAVVFISAGSVDLCHIAAMQVKPQERMFRAWDKNGDGILRRSEVPEGPRRIFDQVDKNHDGKVTLAEHLAATYGAKSSRPPADSGDLKRHVIRQTWSQEPDGFDREFFVHAPTNASEKWPVTFLFHGNGGSARPTLGQWPRLLQGHIVVSPQGYQRSWNILDEKSRAPDVEYFKSMVAEIKQKYLNADLSNISLIGFSNGAGYVFRLMIELDEAVLIRSAVPLISSMVEQQYHQKDFWNRSDDSKSIYDMKAVPVGIRHILTIHGTADRVVPYKGGMRGRTVRHLSAQDTAYAWAVQQGFKGKQLRDSEGTALSKEIVRYNYPQAKVTHLKVVNGGHGFESVSRQVNDIVKEFIQANVR